MENQMKHLANHIRVFIPSAKLHRVRREFENAIVSGIGGFTTSNALGGWRGHDGTVVNEAIIIYDLYYKDEDATIVSEAVFDVCYELLQGVDPEEAVLLEDLNGCGAIIYPDDVAEVSQEEDAVRDAVVPV